jgi:20S proteasome subunit beta 2
MSPDLHTDNIAQMLRNFERPNERVHKEKKYGFRRGTTAWKKEDVRTLIVGEDIMHLGGGDAMEVDST